MEDGLGIPSNDRVVPLEFHVDRVNAGVNGCQDQEGIGRTLKA
jgi:hypothetical protein